MQDNLNFVIEEGESSESLEILFSLNIVTSVVTMVTSNKRYFPIRTMSDALKYV